MKTDDYKEFNDKIYKEFKNTPSDELLTLLEKWELALDKEIGKIGEDKIRQKKHMSWVFDEGTGSDDESHFGHHINQVKRVLENK